MDKICDCNVDCGGFSITALYRTQYNDGNFCVLADFAFPPDDEYPEGMTEQNAISVNIPGEALNLMAEGEFFLKNWNERETLATAMLASGLIVDSGSTVPTGHVRAPIVRLNCGE